MPYATIQPPFTLKLREMPKKELRRYYQWFMDILPDRIKELAAAVRETPGFESWQPDFDEKLSFPQMGTATWQQKVR
jgi:hypothetical protein